MSRPDSEACLPPAGVDRAFALVFLILATVAWGSLTLAEFALFTRAHLLMLGGPIVMSGAWWIWRDTRTTANGARLSPRCHVFILAGCLVAAATAAIRPVEYLVAGGDASVYVNLAEVIQHRGGIRVAEPLLNDLDTDMRSALFERDSAWPSRYDLFPGGFQVAPNGRDIEPNFFHLWPAAMAGFAVLTGWTSGATIATPLAGMLAIAAVWLLALRLSSVVAATTATLLLTVSFAQVWFTRYPSSEAITQCLVLSGLTFTVWASRNRSPMAGAFAGVAFGLAACARLEVLMLVSPVVAGYLGLLAVRGRWTRATTLLALAFGALTFQAVLHACFVATAYTQRVVWRVFATDWWVGRTTLLVPALVLAAGVVAYLAWWSRRSLPATDLVRGVLSVLLLAALVRSWPHFWSAPASLLLTPAGLAAMAFGAVWLAFDDPEPEVLLVVVLFVASAVIYLDAPRATRWMPLVWRRLVPVVLPIGVVLIGHLASRAWRVRGPWRWLAAAVVTSLAAVGGSRSLVLFTVTPMVGLRAQVTRVADSLPANGLTIMDGTTPAHLGLSLNYGFDRPVLQARHTARTPEALESLADRLEAAGRPLMLVVSPPAASGALRRSDFEQFDLMPISTSWLDWTELQPSMGQVPTEFRDVRHLIELYAVRRRQPHTFPVTLDIGTNDFPWRGDGFFDSEEMGEASARWTSDVGEIDLPRFEPVPGARLVLRLAAPRPPGPPASTTVMIDGLMVGVASELGPGFTEVEFDLDRSEVDRLTGGPTRLTLRTTPFVPRDAGAGDDPRRLGVVVDWLRFESP